MARNGIKHRVRVSEDLSWESFVTFGADGDLDVSIQVFIGIDKIGEPFNIRIGYTAEIIGDKFIINKIGGRTEVIVFFDEDYRDGVEKFVVFLNYLLTGVNWPYEVELETTTTFNDLFLKFADVGGKKRIETWRSDLLVRVNSILLTDDKSIFLFNRALHIADSYKTQDYTHHEYDLDPADADRVFQYLVGNGFDVADLRG